MSLSAQIRRTRGVEFLLAACLVVRLSASPAAGQPETDTERRVRARLEESLRSVTPSHELVFRDGRVLKGRVVSESTNEVRFSETHGAGGGMALTVRREKIARLTRLADAAPAVSLRDVRFQIEYPAFRLYKRPPYTILTDDSFSRVEQGVRALQALDRQIAGVFGELVSTPDRPADIQILFFAREEQYRAYMARHSPDMEDSAGYYDPAADRLVVVNQADSGQVREAQEYVNRMNSQHRTNASAAAVQKLDAWTRETSSHIAEFAETRTMAALRHEGVHQLLGAYGILRADIGIPWLVEGLAVYGETAVIGDPDPDRVKRIRQAASESRLIPLTGLVNLRDGRGLLAFREAERVELAYAQSWLLVRLLMREEFRPRFFDFIRQVRDPGAAATAASSRPLDELCAQLGIGAEDLARRCAAEAAGL